MNTVQQLRNTGYKVRISHFRYDNEGFLCRLSQLKEENVPINHRGGVTMAEVTFPDGTNSTGVAYCSSADSFNRKKALNMSVGRALKGVKVKAPREFKNWKNNICPNL